MFAAAAGPRLRTLILDGRNNHDWRAGTRAIRQILEATGRFKVDVATLPAAVEFGRYDVVVNNFNGGHLANGVRWPAVMEESLDQYVSGGGGLVIFHAANNAFLEWRRYNEMIGLGWREPAFGPGLTIAERGERPVIAADELRPGHGPRHDFVITTREPRHPITRGMPKEWLHPAEQLTHGQHGPAAALRELRVLTYAWSKDSRRREPMDWVRRWGRGRIYTTMLGHTWRNERNPNLQCRGFAALLGRGTEWAATGRVSLRLPERLPSREAVALDRAIDASPSGE